MASKNTYRPGNRNSRFKEDTKISENRLAWIRTNIGQAVIMYYENKEDIPENEVIPSQEKIEYGPTVRLMIPQPRGRAFFSDITSLTMEELTMLREFYNLLFDLAEPSILERDRIAKDAYSEGNDSYSRSYRPVAQFVVRQGTIRSDRKGIQHRLASLLEGTGDRRGLPRGLRGDSTELATGEPEEDGAQDNGTTPDEPESLREVGGMGSSVSGVHSASTSEGDTTPST